MKLGDKLRSLRAVEGSLRGLARPLTQQEQDKFIDHRFNKQLVRRLTNLTGEALDSFMVMYRPTYEFTLLTSDYDFQSYIKKCYEQFKSFEAKKEKSF